MVCKARTLVLALAVVFVMGLPVYAETGGTAGPGNTVGPGNTGTITGNPGYNTNAYRTTAADNNTDWGWIGLLGLVGLAGIMGRNRAENPKR